MGANLISLVASTMLTTHNQFVDDFLSWDGSEADFDQGGAALSLHGDVTAAGVDDEVQGGVGSNVSKNVPQNVSVERNKS